MSKVKVYKNKLELVGDLIKNDDVALDVGFWGQGIKIDNENWVHNLILKRAKTVYGLDTEFDENRLRDPVFYKKGNAENFDFNVKFDIIFAGDLIEHLSNPGLFLESCARNLKDDGRLIITTPNCFSLFSLVEKITKFEPTVNKDHVCYFNFKTATRLLEKNNFIISEMSFLYGLEINFKESWKKKILNIIYYLLSLISVKFIETLVVVAQKNKK